MRSVIILALGLLMAANANAKIVEETVTYKHGDVELKGFLAYDDAKAGKRPGVLVVHEWWGLNDYAKGRARQLAELGYVAFAVDMYGGGKNTTKREEASKWAGELYGNVDLLRARAQAGLEQLTANANVDRSKVAAIGYCFGGGTVAQLAYSGADLAGVVSFHGNPSPPKDADAGRIKAKMLVLEGATDPLAGEGWMQTFVDGVAKAKVDCQVISYVGAVHAFTNPAADKAGIEGVAYDADADRRSWAHMRAFFDEIFGAAAGRK